MKRYRLGFLCLVVCWLGFLAAWGDGIKAVKVVIVTRRSDAQMELSARSLGARIQLLAERAGLTPAQLEVDLFDFDAAETRQQLEQSLHIAATDLLYVGMIGTGDDGSKTLLFSIKSVQDVEKSAAATVRTARGLFGAPPVAAGAPEDPVKMQESLEFYAWLLKNPTVLGFHPDARTVTSVMESIRNHYVDPISDQQMEAGIVRQVGYLLKTAGQPSDAMAGLPRDTTLPARILETYGAQVNRDVLGWAEVRGVLEPLDDPHSALLTPGQTKSLNNTLQETAFAGIGVHTELDRRNGNQFVVLDVVEDGPAAQAGLRPGDVLVRVDHLSTAGLSSDLVTSLLRGAVGTTVPITVRRAGALLDLSVVRAVIKPRTVSSRLLDGNIGYVRLSTYSNNSSTELEAVLLKWKMARVKALILDVRNNPGGYVNTAQQLCSLFLEKGKVVMTLVERGGAREYLQSLGPGDYGTFTIVLLVNGYSASASELTAGCFKDHHVGTLIGMRTFGKGSMQVPFDFPNHMELKLTIAHFFSPSGSIIDRLGIAPDIEVRMDPASIGTPQDIQLQKAIEVIRARVGSP